MSRLFSLARQASEYLRNRFQRKYRELDESVERRTGRQSDYGSRRGLPARLPEIIFGPPGQDEQLPGAPPVQPPPIQPTYYPPQSPSVQPPPVQPPPVQPGRQSQPPEPPPSKPLKVPIQRTPPTRPVPRPSGAPPYVKPQEPLRPDYGPPDDSLPPGGPVDLIEQEFDDVKLLGRDAGYDPDDFAAVMENMRLTPGSSNVWGYFYERESRKSGILYVTFLQQGLDGKKIQAPGPTYAYYDVPVTKAIAFQKATASSAGGAVWDYCRVRGSVYAHQHQYRLVHVSGDYVPRKASRYGYVARAVPALGVGRRSYRRNTLSPIRWGRRDNRPNRGEPDRGEPDRGEPDRG